MITLPDNYFNQDEFEERKLNDKKEWFYCMSLTNDALMLRIKEAIQCEKRKKAIEIERSEKMIKYDWSVLIKSKLFNKIYI